MTDTAQPVMAAENDPNVQLADAALAFRAFDNPSVTQPRDDTGKFASRDEQPDETDEAETELEAAEEEAEEGEDEALDDEAEEAAEPAQPLPPSWPADKAEVWDALPAPAKALIAERDAEQLRATNARFQEIANARKAVEAEARAEANAKRNELIQAYEAVEGLYKAPEPDPRAFGYGTQQFNEPAFRAAHLQWQQNEQALAQFSEQRTARQKEADEAAAADLQEWLTSHNAEVAPKFLELVPELADQAKAAPIFDSVFRYAQENGVEPGLFEPDNVKNIPLGHIQVFWKAMQYDKLRATESKPKPKPVAGPAVKPGVSSPRSAQKASRQQRSMDRLAREGTVEAGADVFKSFFKG